MGAIASKHLSTRDYDCLYDSARLADDEVRQLLCSGLDGILGEAKQHHESPSLRAYRVQLYEGPCFLRRLSVHRLGNCMRETLLQPTCFRIFKNAVRLLNQHLPTPAPLLAAVLRGDDRREQILVTDFCPDAEPLDAVVRKARSESRDLIIPELARLLCDFHAAGFSCRNLQAHDILVETVDGKRRYWLTDVRQLRHRRLQSRQAYIRTVRDACRELYEHLPRQERRFLLVSCFDYALKRNIFSEPSQERHFVEAVMAGLREPLQRGFFLRWNW